MYNRNLKMIVEGPQNPPVKPLSGKGEVIEQPVKPPKPATNTPVELANKRIAEYKKSLTSDELKEIDKIVPVKDGSFRIYNKSKSIQDVFPSGRYVVTSGTDGSKYMGTYNNNWIQTNDSAEQTYEKYGDKAWLDDDEKKQLGVKYNNDTKKYEKIDQSNTQPENTTTPDNTGTPTPTPTPRKRGTPLNTQDYEGINFKYKYPGDKNYRYGVKGTDWYAKNINNDRVFNISKDGFTSSVDNLNRQFTNAFKEVVQPITPETPTQDSTKVVTNVPPVKPVDSANTGTPVKPVDSANTGTNIPPQVKFVDSTTYKLEKI
jgi:hypothetical protein